MPCPRDEETTSAKTNSQSAPTGSGENSVEVHRSQVLDQLLPGSISQAELVSANRSRWDQPGGTYFDQGSAGVMPSVGQRSEIGRETTSVARSVRMPPLGDDLFSAPRNETNPENRPNAMNAGNSWGTTIGGPSGGEQ